MPVTNTYTPGSYTGNGASTVFAYGFKIAAQTDLLVKIAGVTKTLTTDYTVSGVGSETGGNVTFVVAPANGASVTIERNVAYTRPTDYQRNGAFDEQTVDADFDRQAMLIQQLDDRVKRAPQLAIPAGGVTTPVVLPAPGAGGYLRWNVGGTALEAISVVDPAQQSANFVQSGAGAVPRSWTSKAGETVDAADFGCLPGALALDNSNAVEKALASGAKRVKFSTPGTYLFDTTVLRTCANDGLAEPIRCAMMPREGQEIVVEAGVTLKISPWVSEPPTYGAGSLIFALKAHGFRLSGAGKLQGDWAYGVVQAGRDALNSQHCVHVASSKNVWIGDGRTEITGAWTDGVTVSYFGNSATFYNSRNVHVDGWIHDNQRIQVSGVGWIGGSIYGELVDNNANHDGTHDATPYRASPFSGIDLEPNNVTGLADGAAVCKEIRIGAHTKGNQYGVQLDAQVDERVTHIVIEPSAIIEDGIHMAKAFYCTIEPGVVKRLLDDIETSNPVSGIVVVDSNHNVIAPLSVYDCRKHGIEVDVNSDHNTVAPGLVMACSQETTNTYSGIYVAGRFTYIAPKKIHKGTGGAVNKYGVEIAASALSSVLALPSLYQSGQTGNVSDASGSTVGAHSDDTVGAIIVGVDTLIQTKRAVDAPGGGAAATPATIGGTGPATAAQHGWRKTILHDGTSAWEPIWK